MERIVAGMEGKRLKYADLIADPEDEYSGGIVESGPKKRVTGLPGSTRAAPLTL